MFKKKAIKIELVVHAILFYRPSSNLIPSQSDDLEIKKITCKTFLHF